MATIGEQLTEQQKTQLAEKAALSPGVEASEKLTVQDRTGSGGGIWWFHRHSEFDVSPWWSPQRDLDLRAFVKRDGNDILAGAVSSVTKKFRAMNWVLEGPKTTVARMQQTLSEAEFGNGWSTLIGKTVEDYSTVDRGTFWELIGEGAPDQPMDGLPIGIAHLDSLNCILTGDPTYPVLYHGRNGVHKMHATRVVHMVDMESPNANMNGIGFSACSRVVASSSILLLISQYKVERLEDLPPAGLLLLNNIMAHRWEDEKAGYERERRKLRNEIWANVMVVLGLDPEKPVSADFLNFSQLPEQYNEKDTLTNYINIVALAFGVDVREFWPMSTGNLGSAEEVEIMAQKAKGKGIGDLISTIERAVNWHIMPKRVTFSFDFQDDDEDKLRADIEQTKVETILSMYDADPLKVGAANRDEVRQMLADNTSYFREEFLEHDVSDETIATDTDVEEKCGKNIVMDRKGKTYTPMAWKQKQLQRDPLYATVLGNVARGDVSLEQLEEYVRLERNARQ